MTVEYFDRPRTYATNPFMGIVAVGIEHGTDDRVVWRYSDEEKEHFAKIRYTRDDAKFITPMGSMYLSMFM